MTLTRLLVSLAALSLVVLVVVVARGCGRPGPEPRDLGAVVLDSTAAAEITVARAEADAALAEADRLRRSVDSMGADLDAKTARLRDLSRQLDTDSLRRTLHALPPDSLAARLDRAVARRR